MISTHESLVKIHPEPFKLDGLWATGQLFFFQISAKRVYHTSKKRVGKVQRTDADPTQSNGDDSNLGECSRIIRGQPRAFRQGEVLRHFQDFR